VKAADVPVPHDGILFRELDDGCVLYDPAHEKVHSLNVTAGAIWCLLDGRRSLAQVADELSSALGADHDTALQDVLRAVRRFASQGLLE
jgi:hypothetical protein